MTSIVFALFAAVTSSSLDNARDRQDRPAMAALVSEASAYAAKHPNEAEAHYRLALAESYLAEVATELKDMKAAEEASEAGIKSAERAVALKPDVAEHHRLLGTLCGQVIPANKFLGLKYGRCAMDSINKALQLDPKSALAYLSRGVGNYYLPPMFGGSVEKAIADFQKASELDPKLSDAPLWLGIAYRKTNRNAEAQASFKKALELSPNRIWAKQQLDKTPAK